MRRRAAPTPTPRPPCLSRHIVPGAVRITEVVGSSPNSFSDTACNAIKAAAETVRGVRGVEVISSNADVDENGNLTLYKARCKIAFFIER